MALTQVFFSFRSQQYFIPAFDCATVFYGGLAKHHHDCLLDTFVFSQHSESSARTSRYTTATPLDLRSLVWRWSLSVASLKMTDQKLKLFDGLAGASKINIQDRV